MILRSIKCGEVIVRSFNIRSALNGIPQAHEDVFHLLAHLFDKVLSPRRKTTSRQCHISRLGTHTALKLNALKRHLTFSDCRFNIRTHRIGKLSHSRPLVCGNRSHHPHNGRKRSPFTQCFHAELFECAQVSCLSNTFQHLLANLLQFFGHSHMPLLQ